MLLREALSGSTGPSEGRHHVIEGFVAIGLIHRPLPKSEPLGAPPSLAGPARLVVRKSPEGTEVSGPTVRARLGRAIGQGHSLLVHVEDQNTAKYAATVIIVTNGVLQLNYVHAERE